MSTALTLAGAACAFAAFAAVATLVRAEISRQANRPGALPWGTLAVNVVGSFALGVLVGTESTSLAFVLATTAGLGTLTTMSALAREVASLLTDGQRVRAALYVALTLLAGIGAAWIGLVITS